MADQKKNNARLFDAQLPTILGINPMNGMPSRMKTSSRRQFSMTDLVAALSIMDEQDAVNRYNWYNLPGELTGQELERMIYYRGQLAFFYYEPLDKFYIMPYALDGTIDFYGRFNRVHPVPFANGATDGEGMEKESKKALKRNIKAQEELLTELKLNVVYDVVTDPTDEMKRNSCVLLHDYTKQLGQTTVPRSQIQDPIIGLEAEVIPLVRTALIASCGLKGVRVNSADEKSAIKEANDQIYGAALRGDIYIPILGSIEFQELVENSGMKSQDYLMMLQAIDNLRLQFLGIDTGGLFQKKAHELQSEQEMNEGPTSLVADDGLRIRQNFCIVANSIWPTGMWCEKNEKAAKQMGAAPNGYADDRGNGGPDNE